MFSTAAAAVASGGTHTVTTGVPGGVPGGIPGGPGGPVGNVVNATGSVTGVTSVGGVGPGGGMPGGSMAGVPSLNVTQNVAPAPSAPGADMKRAYEALGIACPTSVSNMGAFPRARPPVPRPPGLTDVVPQQQQQTMQQLFTQQPDMLRLQASEQPSQQSQQALVSTDLVASGAHCVKESAVWSE